MAMSHFSFSFFSFSSLSFLSPLYCHSKGWGTYIHDGLGENQAMSPYLLRVVGHGNKGRKPRERVPGHALQAGTPSR